MVLNELNKNNELTIRYFMQNMQFALNKFILHCELPNFKFLIYIFYFNFEKIIK